MLERDFPAAVDCVASLIILQMGLNRESRRDVKKVMRILILLPYKKNKKEIFCFASINSGNYLKRLELFDPGRRPAAEVLR